MTRTDLSPVAQQSFPLALAALAYAAQVHAGQRRGVDGAPFILHALDVAGLLYHADAPDHVIAAGVLHGTVGTTDADADELGARFGSSIATLVLAVSENEQIIDCARRKAALRAQVAVAGREALMIFAAEKISGVRGLRCELARARSRSAPTARTPDRRVAHYCECLRLLDARLPDSPLTSKLRAELEKAARIAQGESLVHGVPGVGGRR